MTPDQLSLMRRLLRAVVTDQTRAFSATWSLSRVRTVLMDQVHARGHQVIDPGLPGTPSFVRSAKPAMADDEPDLKVLARNDSKPLFIDILCASRQSSQDTMSLAAATRRIARLTTGHSDLLLISADADAYDRVRVPESVVNLDDEKRHRVVAAVFPASNKLSASERHRVALGDVSIEAMGVRSMAFGTPRVACAVYVDWSV